MVFQEDQQFAKDLDRNDPLKNFRDHFLFPQTKDGNEVIYFCGNSLGLQPKTVKEKIDQELKDWSELAVGGHVNAKHPWVDYHEFLAPSIARIVGAKENEVVVMNSLTVNLHLMLTTFYKPDKKRNKILLEAGCFSSDAYAVESHIRSRGYNPDDSLIYISPENDSYILSEDKIEQTINNLGDSVSMVLIGGVNYYTGQLFDMKHIAAFCKKKGIVIGYDLAHAIGNVPLKLHDWDVDFAVWCSYKYLNSGPGGTGGMFIHEKHSGNTSLNRLGGWWGHEKEDRFLMKPGFHPMPTAEGWQLSNAPVVSMAVQLAALEEFDKAGLENLFDKSKILTAYLEFLLQQILSRKPKIGFQIITPEKPEKRGAQLSLHFPESGKSVFEKLSAAGIIADWRSPSVIRITPVPLYNSFEEVFMFGKVFEKILNS